MVSRTDLPPLDGHAHIATDVTAAQVRRLGGAVVLAVTRDLSEASTVPHGAYPTLVWGVGVHPGSSAALQRYEPDRFERLIQRFALVGEIGLDKRAGDLPRQREVLSDILARAARAPVIMSIHSRGASTEVIEMLEQARPSGAILHWFTGTREEVPRAIAAGAWFSVNAAMKEELLAAVPRDRALTETDFPYTRKHGSARPGSVEAIEARLAVLWACSTQEVRATVWRNFAQLLAEADVSHLSDEIRGFLP